MFVTCAAFVLIVGASTAEERTFRVPLGLPEAELRIPTDHPMSRAKIALGQHRGAFKTSTLRDVARRGPCMRDASLRTLAEVVAFYDRGGIANSGRSPLMRPLGLTEGEQDDLVAFMEALTGEIDPRLMTRPVLPPGATTGR